MMEAREFNSLFYFVFPVALLSVSLPVFVRHVYVTQWKFVFLYFINLCIGT